MADISKGTSKIRRSLVCVTGKIYSSRKSTEVQRDKVKNICIKGQTAETTDL